MQRLIIGALLATLACIAPTTASALVTGHITIGYEDTQFDYDNNYYYEYYGQESYDGPSLSAAVVSPLRGDDGPWIIQGDARLQSQSSDYGYYSQNYEESSGHAAVHVAYRTDDYAVGGFYGMQNWYGHDIQQVGVEAQKYFSGVTLQGSAAYGEHDGPYWDSYSAWDAQASANFYVNPNTTVGVGVGYAAFDYYGGETELTTVEVNGEYRFPNTRYSVRAAYIRGDASDTYVDYTTDTFQVGLVIDLGAGGAQERDQKGASLSGADAFDTHWRLWQAGYYYN